MLHDPTFTKRLTQVPWYECGQRGDKLSSGVIDDYTARRGYVAEHIQY